MFWNKGKIRSEHSWPFRSRFSSLDPFKINLCCSVRALVSSAVAVVSQFYDLISPKSEHMHIYS